MPSDCQKTAQLLDGNICAQVYQNQLKAEIQNHLITHENRPGLAVIQIGSDPASTLYINKKKSACAWVNIETFSHQLAHHTSESELLQLIEHLNHEANIHGILVQMPLPRHINPLNIIEAIRPSKDVDGLHPHALGHLIQKDPTFTPCTPYGIQLMLQHYQLSLSGLNTVIVGSSITVGRPIGLMCLNENATITLCHSATRHLKDHIQTADCLITAIGNPHVIDPNWLTDYLMIIDVGIHRSPEGRVMGDIPQHAALHRTQWLTPVPGGVGPMTVTALLLNTWQAYQRQNQHKIET
ncbi:MAG: bifunctional methylenetetrahydrofolate dehydrogenase/methenyltetrahydrofolate cyclohydrolase [Legionellales bacterium]|nr:bifunctional methylenetetrahydrofolate dehydrogenase/methenyltetrahydrofolate cyclohydrolase [Legionellales bacterium]